MLSWMPSGSRSPAKSSRIWMFGGRLDIISCNWRRTTGRKRGNQAGLFRTLGGAKKNLTAGNVRQNAKIPEDPVKIWFRTWFKAPSPPPPSSPIPSTRQLVRKDRMTTETWKKLKYSLTKVRTNWYWHRDWLPNQKSHWLIRFIAT